MQKLICLVCVALFTVALAGCGGEPPKEMPKTTPEQQADMKKSHEEAAKGAGGQPTTTPEGK